MSKNWHHFSAKEHREFLLEHGFVYTHTEGDHEYYFKKDNNGVDRVVQIIIGNKEKKRQSRKTMDMSSRHSGIPKTIYKEWINKE